SCTRPSLRASSKVGESCEGATPRTGTIRPGGGPATLSTRLPGSAGGAGRGKTRVSAGGPAAAAVVAAGVPADGALAALGGCTRGAVALTLATGCVEGPSPGGTGGAGAIRRMRARSAGDIVAACKAAASSRPAKIHARYFTGYSCSTAGVPGSTAAASASTFQLVSRMQPWESVLPTCAGAGVPWMP